MPNDQSLKVLLRWYCPFGSYSQSSWGGSLRPPHVRNRVKHQVFKKMKLRNMWRIWIFQFHFVSKGNIWSLIKRFTNDLCKVVWDLQLLYTTVYHLKLYISFYVFYFTLTQKYGIVTMLLQNFMLWRQNITTDLLLHDLGPPHFGIKQLKLNKRKYPLNKKHGKLV